MTLNRRIEPFMILRSPTEQAGANASAWEAVTLSQQTNAPIAYATQPAHAKLAGVIASHLNSDMFGTLPPEVVDAISGHDAGWALLDLAALEGAENTPPKSFVEYDADKGVKAWKRSIQEAHGRSLLAGILTSRHFCLLAPKQSTVHQRFLQEETNCRRELETDLLVESDDLDRYTAALGFCDLVSLSLCSGIVGSYTIPQSHPADPSSLGCSQLMFSATETELRFHQPVVEHVFEVSLAIWEPSGSGSLKSRTLNWRIH